MIGLVVLWLSTRRLDLEPCSTAVSLAQESCHLQVPPITGSPCGSWRLSYTCECGRKALGWRHGQEGEAWSSVAGVAGVVHTNPQHLASTSPRQEVAQGPVPFSELSCGCRVEVHMEEGPVGHSQGEMGVPSAWIPLASLSPALHPAEQVS